MFQKYLSFFRCSVSLYCLLFSLDCLACDMNYETHIWIPRKALKRLSAISFAHSFTFQRDVLAPVCLGQFGSLICKSTFGVASSHHELRTLTQEMMGKA